MWVVKYRENIRTENTVWHFLYILMLFYPLFKHIKHVYCFKKFASLLLSDPGIRLERKKVFFSEIT